MHHDACTDARGGYTLQVLNLGVGTDGTSNLYGRITTIHAVEYVIIHTFKVDIHTSKYSLTSVAEDLCTYIHFSVGHSRAHYSSTNIQCMQIFCTKFLKSVCILE